MRLINFYSEGELSSIRVSNVDDTVREIKNLLFEEQLVEEQILLEIYSANIGKVSQVDELRLDFDRIYSKKQILKKSIFAGGKFIDSAKYDNEFSVQTILGIKNEEKYLNAKFQDYHVLISRSGLLSAKQEPMLFARLKNNNFYLLNQNALNEKSGIKAFFQRTANWIKKTISFRTSSK